MAALPDTDLALACRELAELRKRLAALAEREKLAAADLLAALEAAGLDFVDFAPGRRMAVERPSTRSVDEARFLAACHAHELEPDEIVACFTRRVSVTAARKLLGDLVAFDSVCDVAPGAPRLRETLIGE